MLRPRSTLPTILKTAPGPSKNWPRPLPPTLMPCIDSCGEEIVVPFDCGFWIADSYENNSAISNQKSAIKRDDELRVWAKAE